jgi:hypothetical protein
MENSGRGIRGRNHVMAIEKLRYQGDEAQRS